MNGEYFTMGHLAEAVTSGNERLMRKLLNEAGANPPLNENLENPLEKVHILLVIDLAAVRADDWVGHRLTRLLFGEAMEVW